MKLILTVSLLFIVLAGAVAQEGKNVNYFKAEVLVDFSGFSTDGAENDVERLVSLIEDANTAMILLKTYALLNRVIEQAEKEDWYDEFTNSIGASSRKELYREIQENLDYKTNEDSSELRIYYHNQDSDVAVKFLNLVAKNYIKFYRELAKVNEWDISEIGIRKEAMIINGEPVAGGDATR